MGIASRGRCYTSDAFGAKKFSKFTSIIKFIRGVKQRGGARRRKGRGEGLGKGFFTENSDTIDTSNGSSSEYSKG